MANVKIDFSGLEDAARKCRDVADRMDDYADELPRKVNTPLGSLSGGSSANTATAASLASQKAAELRSRASSYRSVAREIEDFSSAASEADAWVAKRIGRVADSRAEDLSFWDKVGYVFHEALNFVLGDSDAATFLKNAFNWVGTLKEGLGLALTKVYDFFKRGEGRYVLDIVLSVASATLAVIAAVALFPASGFIACLMAGLTAFVALDSVLDAFATIYSSGQALFLNSTEPGLARYRSQGSSLSGWFKQNTTNRGLQNFFEGFGLVADLAGIVTSIGGLGQVKTNGKVTGYDFGDTNVIRNLKGSLGLKPKLDDKGSPVIGADGKELFEFKPNLFNFNASDDPEVPIKRLKSISGLTKFGTRADETFDTLGDGIKNGDMGDILKGLSDISSGFKSAVPNVSLPGTYLNAASNGYDWGELLSKGK